MSILAVALPILAFVVLLFLLVEIRQYRAGRHLVSARRFGLRLVAGLLMIGLFTAIFVGLFVLDLREAGARPVFFLGFWSGCLVIALGLVWVMLADMREVGDRLSQRQHEMWRDFARFLAKTMSSGKQGEASGPKGEHKGNEQR